MASGPIRVAVVNDYEIVVAGVAAMLAPHRERVSIVELDSSLPVISDVDVILYDTFAAGPGRRRRPRGPRARRRRPGRDLQLERRRASWSRAAIERGAAGYLSKGLDAEQVVAGDRGGAPRRDRRPRPSRRVGGPGRRRRVAGPGARAERPRGRGARADHPGAEQPGDRRAHLPVDQLGEDLHPHGLPQDRRHPALAGGRVGDAARLRAGPDAQRRAARPALSRHVTAAGAGSRRRTAASRIRCSQVMPTTVSSVPAIPISAHCGTVGGVRRQLAQHQQRRRPSRRRRAGRSSAAGRRPGPAPGSRRRAARRGRRPARPGPTAATGTVASTRPGPSARAVEVVGSRRSRTMPRTAGPPRSAACRPRAPRRRGRRAGPRSPPPAAAPPGQPRSAAVGVDQRARGDQGAGDREVQGQRGGRSSPAAATAPVAATSAASAGTDLDLELGEDDRQQADDDEHRQAAPLRRARRRRRGADQTRPPAASGSSRPPASAASGRRRASGRPTAASDDQGGDERRQPGAGQRDGDARPAARRRRRAPRADRAGRHAVRRRRAAPRRSRRAPAATVQTGTG